MAQETVLNDSARITPFMGTIHYKVTYPGIKDKALLAMLPDSNVLTVDWPLVRSQSFGGQADEMGEWLLWNGETGEYLWVCDFEKRIYELPADQGQKKLKWTKTPGAKKLNLLGHPAVQYDYVHDKLTDSYWANDSIFLNTPVVDSLVRFTPPFMVGTRRSIPLKMVTRSEVGTTQTLAVSIFPGLLPVGSMTLPLGYERIAFDPLTNRHPLIRQPRN